MTTGRKSLMAGAGRWLIMLHLYPRSRIRISSSAGYETPKPSPRAILLSSRYYLLKVLKPPYTAPTSEDKRRNLWGTFHIQLTTAMGHLKHMGSVQESRCMNG